CSCCLLLFRLLFDLEHLVPRDETRIRILLPVRQEDGPVPKLLCVLRPTARHHGLAHKSWHIRKELRRLLLHHVRETEGCFVRTFFVALDDELIVNVVHNAAAKKRARLVDVALVRNLKSCGLRCICPESLEVGVARGGVRDGSTQSLREKLLHICKTIFRVFICVLRDQRKVVPHLRESLEPVVFESLRFFDGDKYIVALREFDERLVPKSSREPEVYCLC